MTDPGAQPDTAGEGALEFTGERFTPECVREIWYEHWHRYVFACHWVTGLRVLDVACGEGYGSALMARHAAHVTGIDLATDTVAHARARYGSAPNLEFGVGDGCRLPFADGSFEAVISFETIEHLADQATLVTEFRRVLREDGFLLLSSPDREVYQGEAGHHNPHHVRELSRDELLSVLGGSFPAVRLYGQRLMFHSVIGGAGGDATVLAERYDDGQLARLAALPPRPMYHLALCAAADEFVPAEPGHLWLFDDAEQSVYQHYQGEIQRVMAAGGIIAERDAEIERWKRRALAAEADQPATPGPWWRRLFGLD